MKKKIFDGGSGSFWSEDEDWTKPIPNGVYKIYLDSTSFMSEYSFQLIDNNADVLNIRDVYYDFTKLSNNLTELGITTLANRVVDEGSGFYGGKIKLTNEELKLLENTDYVNYINNDVFSIYDFIEPFEFIKKGEFTAIFEDGEIYIGDKNHLLVQIFEGDVYYNDTNIDDKFMKDFIYKIDDSNKLVVKTKYDSIEEFFNSDVENNDNLNSLIIYSIDTKLPLIKLEKIEKEDKLNYRFIVDITINSGDNFSITSTIETSEQLNQKLKQTIEALRQYHEFSKYADDLEDCL